MADTTILKGEYRKEFGKGASRRLRRDGRIPGVLYASHQEPVHFHVDRIETQALVRREGVNAVFELELDGEQFLSMVKVIDQNILTLDIDHLDLQAIKRGEKVEVSVPVIAEGDVEAGNQVLAGDITLPEGFTLVDEADKLVLNIVAEEVAEIPEDGEEAAAEGEAESAE